MRATTTTTTKHTTKNNYNTRQSLSTQISIKPELEDIEETSTTTTTMSMTQPVMTTTTTRTNLNTSRTLRMGIEEALEQLDGLITEESSDTVINDKKRRRSSSGSDLSVFSQSECVLVEDDEDNNKPELNSKPMIKPPKKEPLVPSQASRVNTKKEPQTLDYYFRPRSANEETTTTQLSPTKMLRRLCQLRSQTPTKRARLADEKENRDSLGTESVISSSSNSSSSQQKINTITQHLLESNSNNDDQEDQEEEGEEENIAAESSKWRKSWLTDILKIF